MRIQRCVLCTYGLLLRMYPSAFRKRFASEMLELVGAAELREWPLIFADTSVAIVRCWFEGSPSTAALSEPNAYMSLGGSSLRNLGLGFVLSTAIMAGLAYMGYRSSPPCTGTSPGTSPLLTHVVAPSEAAAATTAAFKPGRPQR
ncbi:MAG TPA: hypothetical protein VFF50_14455 [Candidatus Deferrimicrobiaceae bacterium]|nr:hypothetical protein [Candidatus Deferrimicrobiaceae bacterium]